MTARTLARAGLIVTGAFFLSRVLGWVRLVVISNLFGAGAELDAYFAAFRIPDAMFQLVAAGGLYSALIPVLSGLVAHDEERRAWHVVSTVVNLMMIVLLTLTVIAAFAAPMVVPLVTPGFDAVQIERTTRLTQIMLVSPALLALGAIATSVLNTQNRFGAAAVAPLVYNALIIAAAVVLSPFMGVESLAIGVVLGSLAHFTIQLLPLRGRLQYDFRVDLRDPAARQALLLMAPRALGLGASQITFLINTTLASGLFVGAIVAYNVAFTVLQIPIGIIGVPLGVVLLPSMSRAIATGARTEFGQLVVRSLRLLLYVMLFLTAVSMVLRRQVVTLLFGYGRFDEAALDATANTLLFFLVGMAAHSMIAVLDRAFYSAQDTRTPVTAAIVAVVINVIVSVSTVGALGLSGLALGIAIGAWAEAALLTVLLWKRTPEAHLEALGGAVATFALGAFLAAAGATVVVRLTEAPLGLDPGKVLILAQSAAAAGVAVLIYVAYSRFANIPELSQAVSLAASALRRRKAS